MSKIKITLDPGHGGKELGGNYKGILEKDMNLETCKYMKTLLESHPDFIVRMTRDSDITLSLSDRCSINNRFGADLFWSQHYNAFDSKAKGYEIYEFWRHKWF